MRRTLGLRGMGAALGAAGGLWVVSVFAQDAGVDAGASREPTPIAAEALLYPPPGALGVVLNPGLIVRLEQTISSPPIDPRFSSPDAAPALGEGLLLRDDSGRLLGAEKMVTVDTVRSFPGREAPANPHMEIWAGPFALSGQTHYRVLSRLAVCSTAGGVRIACLQDEYVEIADFTTGTEVDEQGPVIASVEEEPSPGQCLTALSVVASDDHAGPSALRFEPNDAVAFLGPNVVLPTFGGSMTLSLVPIDPSNNRGPAFAFDTQGCFLPETDRLQPIPAPPPRAAARPSPDSGCAVAPGRATSALGVGVTLFLLLTVLATARRRAHQQGPRQPSHIQAH